MQWALLRRRSNFSASHHWHQLKIWLSIRSKQIWATTCLICRDAPQWASYLQLHRSHQPALWHLKSRKICHYNNQLWISKSMILMEKYHRWIVKAPSCSSPRSGLSGRQSIPWFPGFKRYSLCKEGSCKNEKRRSRIIKPLRSSETLPEML